MSKVLVVYTGGTIGMIKDSKTGALIPCALENLQQHFLGAKYINVEIEYISLPEIKDSSNVGPDDWICMASIIEKSYHNFDGFVVLHGTDTLTYSASALSFLFENLNKPVVFTGSQLPIGVKNSDANNNLEWAIKIAGYSKIPEVSIFFHQQLYRANRCTKISSENVDAFNSFNYPFLATVKNSLDINNQAIFPENNNPFTVLKGIQQNIFLIKIYPGINLDFLVNIQAKGIILETFGAGNIPMNLSLLKTLQDLIANGCYVLNVTQCLEGTVDMTKYETGKVLLDIGVIGGTDITSEAALTKMMVVLGNYADDKTIREKLSTPCRGEMKI